MITLVNVLKGEVIVSTPVEVYVKTTDRTENIIMAQMEDFPIPTDLFQKTEIILIEKDEQQRVLDKMITRADTGPIIIVDDCDIINNYLPGKYNWKHTRENQITNENGCITFMLDSNWIETHYLIAYKNTGESHFRLQRFCDHENIRKIGIKLFSEEGDSFDVNSFYTGTFDLIIYGIQSDAIINGHDKLSKLLL